MSHLSAQPEHSRRKRPQRLIGIHQPLEKPPLLQPIPVPTQHPPRNLIRIPVPLTDIIHDRVIRRPHPRRVQVRLVANLQRDEVAPQRLHDEPAHLDGVVERRRGVDVEVLRPRLAWKFHSEPGKLAKPSNQEGPTRTSAGMPFSVFSERMTACGCEALYTTRSLLGGRVSQRGVNGACGDWAGVAHVEVPPTRTYGCAPVFLCKRSKMSRENRFGWLLLPVKSAKKCAGNEKEAKAWSTGLDASCGAEPGAETSMLLHLPSTGANRRLNAPAARDTCDHIMSHS